MMPFESELYTNAEVLPQLTSFKIRDVLVISSLYNYFNMEEGGMLDSQIVSEYKGLRLENPPRIVGVFSADDALQLLKERDFDMVLIVPHLENVDPFVLGLEIKSIHPNTPVILLSQNTRQINTLLENENRQGVDHIYRWSGNPELLIAIIKMAEDCQNAEFDISQAKVRVVVLVEDSPDYYSQLLPIIYKEIVTQIQALIEVGLNEAQRALTLRARPKILLAKTYEEGLALCQKYHPYLLCVISDTRLPKNGVQDPEAGISLLSEVRQATPEVPLLLLSTENTNKDKARMHDLAYIDKNSPNIKKRIHDYFLEYLGFGEFIFRMPNGMEIDRAKDFLSLEAKVHEVPNASIAYHAEHNHFSRWVMARLEISLGLKFRSVKSSDFETIEDLRQFIIANINTLRRYRQKGVVSHFDKSNFDANIRKFVKIGKGSLGGKARGLAFMSDLFRQHEELQKKHPRINITIPKTLVISTEIFELFVSKNNLRSLLKKNLSDDEVSQRFLKAKLPEDLLKNLRTYLKQVKYPLSVRSSSQMEDSHYQPYAGLYRTYMIPNNDPELFTRLTQLTTAIKLVFASTYFDGPRQFSLNTSNQHSKESMAVAIQEVAGSQHGDFFYPAISGVAQSYNYYPFSKMKAEEGIVHMALGLGKTVVDGEKCIRFSPRYPTNIPEFSTINDIINNAQRSFYALRTKNYSNELHFRIHSNLEKREISDAFEEFPVKTLLSTYLPEEDRIRDTSDIEGPKVLTHAKILKYKLFDIPLLINDLLELGKKGFGCAVEIEFSVNFYPDSTREADFYFLQIRPMFAKEEHQAVKIVEEDLENAFCYSSKALGNGINKEIVDIVYIKPDEFRTEITQQIAEEISKINSTLEKANRSYLLAGPGRWGGSDRWLGIPVKWRHISKVGAIVELRNEKLNADPSQGSHFFHNITSLGIHYIMVNELQEQQANGMNEFIDWQWLNSLPAVSETSFIRHVKLEKPMTLKIDGRDSRCVIIKP